MSKAHDDSQKVEMLENQLHQHRMLMELGRVIVSEMDMNVLFQVIMERTRSFMGTEKCSVFMFDGAKNELWSRVSTDLEVDEIRFSADKGISGWVFQNREPQIINDAYDDPRFYAGVDRKTHFRTRNMLCVPLINREGECVGTLQVINKIAAPFDADDQELLLAVSRYITIALENAKLYEDLKVLDKAKERVINHLSHELKTPLAVLSASFKRLYDLMDAHEKSAAEKSYFRGRRQIQRLVDLEIKIDDILNQRPVAEQLRILNVIENAADLVDAFNDLSDPRKRSILDSIARRLDALFAVPEIEIEPIIVVPFLEDILEDAQKRMGSRDLEITLTAEEVESIAMDRVVFSKVLSGILKNAVENTPDEGRIDLFVKSTKEGVQIGFQDYGVGITETNRNLIFGGFFHTQDTDLYSSKKPYRFNAGGAGADLLRIKVFSERLGFSVRFVTKRCPYIPADTDMCPGRISGCKFIHDREGCLTTGGSTFYVLFPFSN